LSNINTKGHHALPLVLTHTFQVVISGVKHGLNQCTTRTRQEHNLSTPKKHDAT
jgi:hypothetical protein